MKKKNKKAETPFEESKNLILNLLSREERLKRELEEIQHLKLEIVKILVEAKYEKN